MSWAPRDLVHPLAPLAHGLSALGQAAFDRRLQPRIAAPIAVAFSGGGDSLAALMATQAWAKRHHRRVVVLHVDHQLQASSGAWADRAMRVAAGLGLQGQVLPWLGDKPTTGIPAAARHARHALIAEAARGHGARVVVFGHTADDQDEGDLMRAQGLGLGRLAQWRPSPVWPQGRGLFLLRPLLDERRAALRQILAASGLDWIDDPANDDARSPRIQARRRLTEGEAIARPPPQDFSDDPALTTLARTARICDGGAIVLRRDALVAAAEPVARRLLAAALTCAAGAQAPPRRSAVVALLSRLRAPGAVQATLDGARLSADPEIIVSREAGVFRRRAEPRACLGRANSVVWDGRFELSTQASDLFTVTPLAGRAKTLPLFQRSRLKALRPEVRAALPLVVDSAGAATCPILATDEPVTAKSLIADRFFAFCGVISNESEI